MKSYRALSVVNPAGDLIRAKTKRIEVRKWKPEVLPLLDLLIIQNREKLSLGKEVDPEGVAVALVDVVSLRDWREEDLDASCAKKWEPGWLAWELSNIRPFDYSGFLPAKRRIYSVALPG